MNSNKSVGIIGGGASGLLLSILLKKKIPSLDVTIYEALDKVGKKLLQTGNGKGNISNIDLNHNCYNQKIDLTLSASHLMNVFKELGLKTKVDNEGRVYPYSERASSILDILLFNINKYGIKIITNCNIDKVIKKDKYYIYQNNNEYICDYLVLATGGISSIAFDYKGYDLAKALGHTITNLAPSLVALKTRENTKSLSGIRVKCVASIFNDDILKEVTTGEVLFKDDGLSGIAILILSRNLKKDSKNIISLDLCPDMNEEDLNKDLESNISEKLMGYFPKMINYDLNKRLEKSNKSIGYLIKHYNFTIIDTYGFKSSQVTRGGVTLSEVDLKTNASLIQKNLYILGELLDIDGTCGGYNLHYAFNSAYNCYLDIVKKVQGEK